MAKYRRNALEIGHLLTNRSSLLWEGRARNLLCPSYRIIGIIRVFTNTEEVYTWRLKTDKDKSRFS